jgi:hypothetical protein
MHFPCGRDSSPYERVLPMRNWTMPIQSHFLHAQNSPLSDPLFHIVDNLLKPAEIRAIGATLPVNYYMLRKREFSEVSGQRRHINRKPTPCR